MFSETVATAVPLFEISETGSQQNYSGMEQFLLCFYGACFPPLMLFLRVGHPCFAEIFIAVIIIDAVVRNNAKTAHVLFSPVPPMVTFCKTRVQCHN